jgi:hypothetical protein
MAGVAVAGRTGITDTEITLQDPSSSVHVNDYNAIFVDESR